jgi:intein/homing endonuclease
MKRGEILLKLGSLFSGSGGFELAGVLQGIVPVWSSEIEPYPIAVTSSRFPSIKHLGDVKNIDGSKIEPVDIITFGSPCFPAGTLVQTNRGLLPIENVRVKDKVLTHTNSWKKVELVGSKMTDKIVELNIMGSPVMETTTNHPFYVCKRKKDYSVYYVDGVPKRHNKKGLSSPQWIEAKDIEIGDFVGIPINLNSTNKYNLTRSECYLLGRYVADGYIDNNKRPHRENSYNHKTIFCIGNKKLDDFLKNVKGYNVSAKSTNNNCKKCEIISERLMNLCGFCGRGANNKTIPKFVMDLPVEHLKCFLDGYISGDGCFRKCWQASTVSKNLAYQLQAAVAKVYNTYAKIYFIKTADTHKIEERIVNQSDIYMIRFQKEARKQDKIDEIEK